jgi:hypothetical protein
VDRAELKRTLHRFALVMVWMAAVVWVIGQLWIFAGHNSWGFDAHAYWLAGQRAHPYLAAPGKADAFLYSPVFALALHAVAWLPWPVFLVLWMVAEAACFVWLVRPMPLRWGIPVLMFCSLEVMFGNIYGFTAVTVVLGTGNAGWWAFGLLTKIVPGLIGVAWSAVQRDVRGLLRLALAAAVLCAASWLIQPSLWSEWITFLRDNSGASQPSLVRVVAGLVLSALSIRRWWLLPIGLALLTPVFVALSPLSLLAAIPRLLLAQANQVRAPAVARAGAAASMDRLARD